MKLLHPEVDIVPGRAGQRPQVTPVREEQPLPGSSVIRLANTTTQENAYTVRIRSEERFWQDSWYTIIALPPGQGAENAPPPGKPDQRGPQDRWVKLFVPRGGTRDILIRFNVPVRPESRAGKYPYTIEVETQIIGPSDLGRRKDRISQIPGMAIVRPYYKWSLDLSPEERRVGRRNRRGEFEIIISNEGNDWLYCDMHLPRPKDLQVESPTLRLAVPPPEPGETLPTPPDGGEARPGTQRTIPFSATTKMKTVRGMIVRQPMALSAQRVDAPSVPPPASDGYGGLGAVVANATTETQQSPGDRALVYIPPIPAKLTDFFTKSAGSVRTLAFTALGFIALIMMSIIIYQNYFFEGVKVEPQSLSAAPGGTLLVSGEFLLGSKMYMGTKGSYVEVNYHPVVLKPGRMVISPIPTELDHKIVKIKAQRFVGFLPFLTPLLPAYESKSTVQIGSVVNLAASAPAVDIVDAGPYKPGSQISITGRNLGSGGAVLIGNLKAKAYWSPNKITATIRPDAKPNAQLPVVVEPEGSSSQLSAGSIEIAAPQAIVASSSTGGSAPAAGGGAAASGGASGGGGAKPSGGGAAAKPSGGAPATPHPAAPRPAVGRPQSVPRPQPAVVSVPRPAQGVAPYDLVLAGAYPQAVGSANDLLARSPSDASALALKAYAFAKMGQMAAAQGPAKQALALTNGQQGRPRALALIAQGTLDEASGNDNGATSAYQAAGNMDQTLGLSYLVFADLLHKKGKDDVAKSVLQAALSQSTKPGEQAAIKSKLASL